jgi:hypothetical protein
MHESKEDSQLANNVIQTQRELAQSMDACVVVHNILPLLINSSNFITCQDYHLFQLLLISENQNN